VGIGEHRLGGVDVVVSEPQNRTVQKSRETGMSAHKITGGVETRGVGWLGKVGIAQARLIFPPTVNHFTR
jgi:hypothetical protein